MPEIIKYFLLAAGFFGACFFIFILIVHFDCEEYKEWNEHLDDRERK